MRYAQRFADIGPDELHQSCGLAFESAVLMIVRLYAFERRFTICQLPAPAMVPQKRSEAIRADDHLFLHEVTHLSAGS